MDPPLTPALAAVSSAAHLPYTDSVESSPRSRTTESWDGPLLPVVGATKLRLMCSHGGHIVPRPHDKALCYVGGDTRMVFVDRNISLADLSAKIAKALLLHTKAFSLKYQLPNEDLDSLISLAGDEDLDIMIEEYDRICAAVGGGGKGSRLRLFVFPAKLESTASLIESLLDGSVNSDEWFLSALNGSRTLSGGFSDSTSVNCLLGLENANSNELGLSRGLGSEFANGVSVKVSNQDIHSVPDSPMMETTSSFGSMNSTPSMANLTPIRVRVNDGGIRAHDCAQDHILGIEEQYVRIRDSAAENFATMSSPPPPPIPVTITASVSTQTTVAASAPVAGDFPSRVVFDDERSDHGMQVGLGNKLPQSQVQQQQQQQQQKPAGVVESPKPDSLPSDGGLLNATPKSNQMGYQEVVQVSAGDNWISANPADQKSNFLDPNQVRVQLQKQESAYMVQPQMDPHQQPQHYPYQQIVIQGGTHYVMQQPGNPMAMPAYYPVYPPQQQAQHPHHQPIPLQPPQYPMYIVQAPQPQQGYTMAMQQATYPEGTSVIHTGHPQTPSNPNRVPESATAFNIYPNPSRAASPNPELASAMYTTTTAGAQPMVQVAPNYPQQQFVNYSQVNHQPQTASAPSPAYSYEIPDPARSQIYFTQPLGPSVISQYQAMAPTQGLEASYQPQNDNINPSQARNL
ncbi:unnamed protein product [Rhodiola kirilowii]